MGFFGNIGIDPITHLKDHVKYMSDNLVFIREDDKIKALHNTKSNDGIYLTYIWMTEYFPKIFDNIDTVMDIKTITFRYITQLGTKNNEMYGDVWLLVENKNGVLSQGKFYSRFYEDFMHGLL